MHTKPPPSLRQHTSGQFTVRYRGKDFYFGTSRLEAQARYIAWIEREWLPDQSDRAETARRRSTELHVAELAHRYLAHVLTSRGPAREQQYAVYLRPWLHAYGTLPCSLAHPTMLDALGAAMSELESPSGGNLTPTGRDATTPPSHPNKPLHPRYKARTINHTLKAVKRMFAWGVDRGLIENRSLDRVPLLRVPPPRPKIASCQQIIGWIEQARKAGDADLASWIGLAYLSLQRPSALVRLINAEGVWLRHGVFLLDVAKNDASRYVVLSDEALAWLLCCRPRWKLWESFSARMVRICGPASRPRVLRSSAATHLEHEHQATREEVRRLLGRAPRDADDAYIPTNWTRYRQAAGRLTLLPVVPTRDAWHRSASGAEVPFLHDPCVVPDWRLSWSLLRARSFTLPPELTTGTDQQTDT